MAWRWVNNEIYIYFWGGELLQHVPWALIWFSEWMWIPIRQSQRGVNSEITGHKFGLDLNQSHLNMNSPRCGLLRNAIALILADPNAAMMEDGQTYNPWDRSRTGGNPFRWMNHRLSDEEISESHPRLFVSGKRAGPMFSTHPVGVQWRSGMPALLLPLHRPARRENAVKHSHSSVFQTWSLSKSGSWAYDI